MTICTDRSRPVHHALLIHAFPRIIFTSKETAKRQPQRKRIGRDLSVRGECVVQIIPVFGLISEIKPENGNSLQQTLHLLQRGHIIVVPFAYHHTVLE